MIYNFVRSAALAWLLHAGIGLVFDGAGEASEDASGFAAEASSGASVFASAAPTASCGMPATESAVETRSSASTETRTTLTVSPLSLIPRVARDAFDLRILPNAARNLRSLIPTLAGAPQS
ncbi:MAG: hypothetical protein SV422_03000 [Pseudomonadota bacterium]|nr:hypothetical protein [Pseudomonadota bacterium]